jgi:predicted Zn-dependent protease
MARSLTLALMLAVPPVLAGCQPRPAGQAPPSAASPSPADIVQRKAAEVHDEALAQMALSPAEQARLGEEFHAEITAEHSVFHDARQQARIERLGRPLTRCGQHLAGVHFVILNDPLINAFSHVGGWVYINRGLLSFVKTDGELRFVLGHELGHVELGHCARQVTVAYRAEQQAGGLAGRAAGLLYRVLTTGYNRDDEFAADRWGRDACLRCGGRRADAINLLSRLARLEAGADQPHNSAQAAAQTLGDHFRSHPPTAERIARLKQ